MERSDIPVFHRDGNEQMERRAGHTRPTPIVNKTIRGVQKFSFKNFCTPRIVLFPYKNYLNGLAKRSSVRILSSVIVFRNATRASLSVGEKFMRLG